MEATKTFTLTIQLDGTEDYGDISEKLRNASNAMAEEGRIFEALYKVGVCEDSDGDVIATWEVR